MKKYLPSILIAIFAVLLYASLYVYKIWQRGETLRSLYQKETKETRTLVSLTTNTLKGEGSNYVVLYLSPLEGEIILSAFSFDIKIESEQLINNYSEVSSILPNITLIPLGWNFPIKEVSGNDGELLIQLSGYYLEEGEYMLTEKTEIARIPVEQLEDSVKLSVVNMGETKVFGKDVKKLSLEIK